MISQAMADRRGESIERQINELVLETAGELREGMILANEAWRWSLLHELAEARLFYACMLGGSPEPNVGPDNNYALHLRHALVEQIHKMHVAKEDGTCEEFIREWAEEVENV